MSQHQRCLGVIPGIAHPPSLLDGMVSLGDREVAESR